MPEFIDTPMPPRYSVTAIHLLVPTHTSARRIYATFPAGRRNVRHPGIDGRGLQAPCARPGSCTGTTTDGSAAATTTAAEARSAATSAATSAD